MIFCYSINDFNHNPRDTCLWIINIANVIFYPIFFYCLAI